ncbi:polysaccharide pyruvyl transferase family protein [uncultured Draconibacterium sp.]|uniref:polysaccharide pyruvyl transferase family protein n=1 Tax=uncultured Draconibacterium sp. TaxID=1573823 RepID=UPI0025D85048|nr:polysaccharide pyruvyl transferase family protein [uncultured Draconibacterium sp.]
MKIGIVTLPFVWNYGGILQTYALQVVLRKLGHEALTINRNSKINVPLKMKILSFGKRFLLRYVLQKKVVVRTWPRKNEIEKLRQHTDRFIKEHVKVTHLLKDEAGFQQLEKYGFKAYVCGSDQVWRPRYSPSIENHFLGFLPEDSKAKRIAFAASFGVDHWEYSKNQTAVCSKLAKKYNAISVREDSGVALCIKHLGVEARQVLDPTLLIPKEEYIALVEKDKTPKLDGSLLNYVLDQSPEKKKMIAAIAKELGLKTVSTMPKSDFAKVGKKGLNDCIFPPVTNWIRGFMDAEFVITDSFHGTAFSIIFNKPFISVGNAKRGVTRFSSLLNALGLEDRLVTDPGNDLLSLAKKKIDFEAVNTKLAEKQEEAFAFLRNALDEA